MKKQIIDRRKWVVINKTSYLYYDTLHGTWYVSNMVVDQGTRVDCGIMIWSWENSLRMFYGFGQNCD